MSSPTPTTGAVLGRYAQNVAARVAGSSSASPSKAARKDMAARDLATLIYKLSADIRCRNTEDAEAALVCLEIMSEVEIMAVLCQEETENPLASARYLFEICCCPELEGDVAKQNAMMRLGCLFLELAFLKFNGHKVVFHRDVKAAILDAVKHAEGSQDRDLQAMGQWAKELQKYLEGDHVVHELLLELALSVKSISIGTAVNCMRIGKKAVEAMGMKDLQAMIVVKMNARFLVAYAGVTSESDVQAYTELKDALFTAINTIKDAKNKRLCTQVLRILSTCSDLSVQKQAIDVLVTYATTRVLNLMKQESEENREIRCLAFCQLEQVAQVLVLLNPNGATKLRTQCQALVEQEEEKAVRAVFTSIHTNCTPGFESALESAQMAAAAALQIGNEQGSDRSGGSSPAGTTSTVLSSVKSLSSSGSDRGDSSGDEHTSSSSGSPPKTTVAKLSLLEQVQQLAKAAGPQLLEKQLAPVLVTQDGPLDPADFITYDMIDRHEPHLPAPTESGLLSLSVKAMPSLFAIASKSPKPIIALDFAHCGTMGGTIKDLAACLLLPQHAQITTVRLKYGFSLDNIDEAMALGNTLIQRWISGNPLDLILLDNSEFKDWEHVKQLLKAAATEPTLEIQLRTLAILYHTGEMRRWAQLCKRGTAYRNRGQEGDLEIAKDHLIAARALLWGTLFGWNAYQERGLPTTMEQARANLEQAKAIMHNEAYLKSLDPAGDQLQCLITTLRTLASIYDKQGFTNYQIADLQQADVIIEECLQFKPDDVETLEDRARIARNTEKIQKSLQGIHSS